MKCQLLGKCNVEQTKRQKKTTICTLPHPFLDTPIHTPHPLPDLTTYNLLYLCEGTLNDSFGRLSSKGCWSTILCWTEPLRRLQCTPQCQNFDKYIVQQVWTWNILFNLDISAALGLLQYSVCSKITMVYTLYL